MLNTQADLGLLQQKKEITFDFQHAKPLDTGYNNKLCWHGYIKI